MNAEDTDVNDLPEDADIEVAPEPTVQLKSTEEPEKEAPSLSETAGAIFREDSLISNVYRAAIRGRIPLTNPVGSWSGRIYNPEEYPVNQLDSPLEQDTNFNLKEHLDSFDVPTDDRKIFKDVVNADQFQAVYNDYQQQKEDQQILNDATTVNKILGSFALFADPVPGMQLIQAMKFGTPFVRTAIEGGAVALSSYSMKAVAEDDFSVFDCAATTIAGATLSATLAKAGQEVIQLSQPRINKIINGLKDTMSVSIDRMYDLDSHGVLREISHGRFGEFKQKAKRWVWQAWNTTPISQAYNSGNPLVVAWAERVFAPNRFSKDVRHLTVEEVRQQTQVQGMRILEQEAALIKESGLTPQEFRKQTHGYLLGIMPADGTPASKYAELISEFQDTQVQEAQFARTLPEDFGKDGIGTKDNLKVLNSFHNRLTEEETRKVALKYSELYQLHKTADYYVPRHFSAELKNNPEKIETLKSFIRKEAIINNPTIKEKELDTIVNEVLSGVTHLTPSNNLNNNGWVNFLDNRKFPVTDKLLWEHNMFEYDPQKHIQQLCNLRTEAEFDNAAQELGFASNADFKKTLYKEGRMASGNALQYGESNLAEATQEAWSYNIKLVEDGESLVKGTFSRGDIFKNNKILGWLNNIRILQYAAQAGQIFLSAIPDIGALFFRTSSLKVLRETFNNMISKSGLNPAIQADRKALQEMLGLFQHVLNDKFSDSLFSGNARFQKVSDFVNKLTLTEAWDKTLKTVMSDIFLSDAITECLKGAKADKEVLARYGIFTNIARDKIAKTFMERGHTSCGQKYLDPMLLSERTRESLITGIRTLTQNTVLTPTAGNIPRYLRTPVGRFLNMFQSYGYMAYETIFKDLANGHIPIGNAIVGSAVGITAAMCQRVIRDALNGKETEFDEDFLIDAISYSPLGIHLIQAGEGVRDVLNRRWGGSIGSVSSTMGFYENLLNLTSSCFNKGVGANLKRISRMLPGTNFWYMRPIMNELLEE